MNHAVRVLPVHDAAPLTRQVMQSISSVVSIAIGMDHILDIVAYTTNLTPHEVLPERVFVL